MTSSRICEHSIKTNKNFLTYFSIDSFGNSIALLLLAHFRLSNNNSRVLFIISMNSIGDHSEIIGCRTTKRRVTSIASTKNATESTKITSLRMQYFNLFDKRFRNNKKQDNTSHARSTIIHRWNSAIVVFNDTLSDYEISD